MSGPQPQDPWKEAYVQARMRGLSQAQAKAEADQAGPVTPAGPVHPMAALWRQIALPAMQGMAFNQIPNLVGAAKAMVPGGEGFTEGKAGVQATLAQGRAENPIGATIAEIAGGIAGPNPLGKLGFIKNMETTADVVKGVGKFGRRAVTGGLIGGAAGAAAAMGEAAPGTEGNAVLPGLGVGAAMGIVANTALAPLVKWAADKGQHALAKSLGDAPLPLLGNVSMPPGQARQLAYGHIFERLNEYGVQNPEALIPVLQARAKIIPEQDRFMALADHLPDAVGLKRELARLGSAPGKAPQVIANFVQKRTTGGNIETAPVAVTQRLIRATNTLFGDLPNGQATRSRLIREQRKMLADPVFDALRHDVTPIDDQDFRFLAGTEEGRSAIELGRRILQVKEGTMPGQGRVLMAARPVVAVDPEVGALGPLTVADAYAMRVGFQELALSLKPNAPLTAATATVKNYEIQPMLDMVDRIASSVSPDYTKAITTYRQHSNMLRGVEAGAKAVTKDAANVTEDLLRLETPTAVKVYQEAFLSGVQKKLKASTDPVAVLDNPLMKERFAAVFADRPDVAMGLYQTALGAEAAMRQVNAGPLASISGGDLTKGQGLSTFGGREAGRGRPYVAAFEIIADWFRTMREQLAEEVADEMSQALTATGNDLYAVLRTLQRAPQPSTRLARGAGQQAGSLVGRPTQPGTTLTPIR